VIIFGIDPGTQVTGYGIISTEQNLVRYVDAGIIVAPTKASLAEKLECIYDNLLAKMVDVVPQCVAVEQAFYAKNVHTTLVLGHARGVSLLAARKSGAEVVEFTPREIKKAVVGQGNAAKEQVTFMVRTILRLPQAGCQPDMYDALATALCAFNNRGPEWIPYRKDR
jgi:crossover junction endodeoxyribonuclease RuvC